MPTESADGFELFVRIVEAGSISAAARESGTPRETLSRHLSRLEARLGVRLLHRDTRRLVPTRAGEELYRRARPLVAAAVEAAAAVRTLDDTPRGLLRVSVPPGGRLFSQLCVSFLDRYPEIQLEVLSSSRFVDLVAERVDVAVRAGRIRDPSLVARKLWATDLVAVASPAYLAARGRPHTLDDLAHHDCILGYEAGARPEATWPTTDGGSVPVSGRLASNHLDLRHQAVLAGQGVAVLAQPFAADALATGALEVVLPGVIGARTSMALVFVERAFMLPKLRAFVDHVVGHFEAAGADAVMQGAIDGAGDTARPRRP